MIDYYYEFVEGTRLFDEPIKFALQRGYHPAPSAGEHHTLHNQCYINALRIWAENANGLTLVREYGRDVHVKCNPKIMTWIKLQAREL